MDVFEEGFAVGVVRDSSSFFSLLLNDCGRICRWCGRCSGVTVWNRQPDGGAIREFLPMLVSLGYNFIVKVRFRTR